MTLKRGYCHEPIPQPVTKPRKTGILQEPFLQLRKAKRMASPDWTTQNNACEGIG
jgi:hypothetical protein